MKKLNRPVLAEGETTGHAHVLQGAIDVLEHDDGIREFCLQDDTILVHEEHKVITFPPGEYLSDKVNEYDHVAEEAKKVQD